MKSVFKVGSRANVHLTSDKRVFGEIVSISDEFVEILEKRRDRPTASTVYINYSNITCVYPEEEVAETGATASASELKVESPTTPGGGSPGPAPVPGGGAPPAPTVPGGGGPGTPPAGPGPVTPPPIRHS